jgi:hypothetical protein
VKLRRALAVQAGEEVGQGLGAEDRILHHPPVPEILQDGFLRAEP